MYQVVGVGYNCVDKICTVEYFPKEDEMTRVTGVRVCGGGAAATAMVAFARLGGKCAFIGNLGKDSASDEAVRLFEMEGVGTEYLVRRDDCFGLESINMVNTNTGSRTKFPRKDTNPPIAWDERLENAIASAKILHMDSSNYDNAMAAARIAKKHGVLVSLDAATMHADNQKNIDLASIADILIMDKKYPLAVTGKTSREEALLEISTWGPKIVMGTMGEEGSMAVVDGKIRVYGAFTPSKVVDTTGCGDVFHGSFVYAYVNGMPFDQCVRFAAATAALKCEKLGGRDGIPTKEQVLALMEAHPEVK